MINLTKTRLAWSISLLFCAGLFGQSDRGTITGVVKDSSGAVVPGAKITITHQSTNMAVTGTSNEAGEYAMPSLRTGVYNVRAEKEGFRPSEEKGLVLNAGQTVRSDARLEVGTSTQTIEVQASAIQLQSEDARSSTTLENKLVNDLPLVVSGTVRTPLGLAGLTAGAKNIGGDTGFVLAGGQAASYGTSLDGVSTNTSRALMMSRVANNSPSVEAIEQFTVETNGFKAEFSHAGGGNLSYVSKSGTATYRGSAYEFLRNNAFDANNFFNNASRISNSIYKQNDFGATLGGPVWIPKLYHGKEKTFFFFSYEGFRNRNGANGTTFTVPTSEMYNGDFRNWVTAAGVQIPIYDPTTQVQHSDGTYTRSVFPGNQIPKNRFNSASSQALSVFQSSGPLTPNNGATPGTAAYVSNNYLVTQGTTVYPVNKWSIKGDHLLSGKHRISGYYGHHYEHQIAGPDGPATLPGLYTNFNDTTFISDVVRLSWDWTLSSNMLNHFYVGWSHLLGDHKPPQESIGNWKTKFCMGNVPDCNDNLVNLFYTATNNPYSTWGGQADSGANDGVLAFSDDFSWTKGSHTFKFGGTYQSNHYDGLGRQCISGCVGFSYQETGVPGGSNSNAGGNSFASFLLGQADSGQIDTIRYNGQYFFYVAGYAQDDWRINSKLILNLGLRYDINLPPRVLDDSLSDFSPNTANPGAGGIPGAVIFAGSGPGRVGSHTLADLWWKGIGPHVGVAYSADSKTVIRGSFSRSFGALVAASGSSHNMGFALTQTFSNSSSGVNPTFTMDQGFPSWTAPPFIDPSVSNGTSVAWYQGKETTKLPAFDNISFSIQRQLGNSTVVEIGYNGVLGEHLQSKLLQINSIDPKYLTAWGSVSQSVNVLNSLVGSATAKAAGVSAPFSNFNTLWGSRATVVQALLPYPQYTFIDTFNGQGDHSGHSTYHALITKLDKRLKNGLTFQASYVFSKVLTDSDSAWGTQGTLSLYATDFYNRGLEKSIGQYDVTHDFKFAGIYDLPFGKGQRWLKAGAASWIVGNWRLSSVNMYGSGTPIQITTNLTLPIYASGASGRIPAYVTSYDGWTPDYSGGFDPGKYRRFVSYGTGPFPIQGSGTSLNSLGNVTRYNPKCRSFANLNENMSLVRTFPIKENVRLEFRAEAFNIFNRVRFGDGVSTQLQSQSFGVLTGAASQTNTPRQLQLALKAYF